ncbi:hypothetical protein NAI02_10640, partial [Francisella tularensis subsp. holarctica]
ATSSQDTTPIATNISIKFLPNNVTSYIAKNKNGNAYKASTILILKPSILPPMKPAKAPPNVPITTYTIVATIATSTEI